MFRRDYILRLCDKLALVMRRVLGMRRAKENQSALQTLTEAFSDLIGLNERMALALSAEDLWKLLTIGGPEPGKGLMAARIFKERSEILSDEGLPDEAANARQKALFFSLYVTTLPGDNPELDQSVAVESLLSLADPHGLPLLGQEFLFKYFEKSGQFADAEDVLFHAAESGEAPENLWKDGTDFYQRLLKMDEAALSAGNLPRSEIIEGSARFASLRKTSGKSP